MLTIAPGPVCRGKMVMMRLGLPLALAAVLGAAVSAQTATPGSDPHCSGDRAPAAAASRIVSDWRISAPAAAIQNPIPREGQDLGSAPDDTRLDRMLLLLQPSAAQSQALDGYLADQQNSRSCAYHQWLTPAEFADAYATSAGDVNAVVQWLQSAGFAVGPLPAGRGWIEFSGTAAQVEQAFGASVRQIATGGGTRYVLAGAVAVPAALRPVIHGLVSLDGALSVPAITSPQPAGVTAEELAHRTDVASAEAMTPALAAQLLHLDTLHTAGTRGDGETIAIAARSNVAAQDLAAFRSAFGLAENAVVVTASGSDPGFTADQAEAEYAASWAGAAAPGARILVAPAATTAATDGVDLSLAAIVDDDAAHTAVVGFSTCEAALSETHRAFYATLYRQAAAQGMAVVAASGDSGASACHAPGSDAPVSTGYAVNALAATPWNTAVGTAAVGSSNAASMVAWSPASVAEPAYAGGGGASGTYAQPNWQPRMAVTAHTASVSAAATVSGKSARLIPDLALPAAQDSAFNRGLAFCFSGTDAATGCTLMRAGGSSGAAAIFGGVAALLAQKYGAQGDVAPRLYALSSKAGVFSDVQQGAAQLACAAGSPGCDAAGKIGYAATTGYDLATGLGVPDANALVSAWAMPDAAGTGAASVVLTVTPAAQNNTYNPSASITFSATVASQSGGAVPSGTVTFSDASSSGTILIGGGAKTLDSTGAAAVTVSSGLAIGGNNVTAIYSGDSNYAAAVSTPPFVVTIAKSQTSLAIDAPSAVAAGSTFKVTVTVTASTPPAGSSPPGGSMTLAVDGVTTATAPLVTAAGVTTATFTVTAPTVNVNHNLQTTYPGDGNYASSVATVAFAISKSATVTTLTATPSVLTPGTAETLTASVAPLNPVTGTTYTLTGSISFYDGAVLLGTVPITSNGAALPNLSLSTATTHLLTAVYSGDTSWATSTSNPVTLSAALFADTVTLTAYPTSAAPGEVVTLTAIVTPGVAPASATEQNPTGNILFYDGTTVLATVALSAGPNNTATATLLNATLPAGQDVLYAYYVGDLFYSAATSNSIALSVQDFAITPAGTNPGTNLTIVKGNAGTASFVVSSLGGYAGEINVVCAVPTQDDMTCSASPQQVTPTGTVTFSIQTYLTGGPSATSAQRNNLPVWQRAAGGTALAALLCFVLPFGGRSRLLRERGGRLLVLALLLAGFGLGGTGCSSVSGSVPNASAGTPLGISTLKITAAANVDNTVVSHSVYLTVNVLPPGSTVSAVGQSGGSN